MFKKLKASLLAAAVLLPAVVTASALALEEPVSNSADSVSYMPISAEVTIDSEDEYLEKAIIAAKSHLGDTDRFERLTHSISNYNGTVIVYLDWSESNTEGEYMSAAVSGDGVLYRFRLSENAEYGLPSGSKADAVKLAYMYAMDINPCYGFLSEDNATVEYRRWNGYNITFHSKHDDYEIENNTVTVRVSPEGRITYYDAFNFARGLTTPESPALISVNEAKEVLKTSLPLELVYQSFYEYDYLKSESKAVIKLVYKLADDYAAKAVDAATGEVVEYERQAIPYALTEETMYGAGSGNSISDDGGIKLSPAEQETVNIQTELLTAGYIDESLRAVSELAVGSELKLTSSKLYTVKSPYDGKLSYKWSITYKDSENSTSVYAEVDAESGEILLFNNYRDRYYLDYYTADAPKENKYSEKQCEDAAYKLLSALYGEKLGAYVKTENSGARLYTSEQAASYTFNYVRTVNDVRFYSDRISITVNPGTLDVISIVFQYTETLFPSAAGVISASDAVDSYFSQVPLKPYYIVSRGISNGKLVLPELLYSVDEKQLTPVYSYIYYGLIDANSGALLGRDGKPAEYKAKRYFNSSVRFVDIGSSAYAEAIETLYNMDIIEMDGVRFRPDDAVTAAELEALMIKAGFWYSGENNGIGSEDLSSEVAMTDALYNMVCALGYSEIASVDEIFKNPFGDESLIAEGRVGAVAIAYALGALDGIAFDSAVNGAGRSVTRGEAAQLAFNMLSRNVSS